MENMLENKAKFFAQYLRQEVYVNSNWDKFNGSIAHVDATYLIIGSNGLNEGHLKLKPLSLITDADAIEFAKICLYDPKVEDWNSEEVWIGDGYHDSNGDHLLEIGMRCWSGLLKVNDVSGSITLHDEDGEKQEIYNVSAVLDFLRSKGYALPWMGLSVEKMVEDGWIKLKEC